MIFEKKSNKPNYRYERKFFLEKTQRYEIEQIVLQNPLHFREIYHERVVNNIYFDTLDFDNFKDNIDGNTYRKKFRIRWYGELFGTVEKPVLELKIKKGLLGDKKSFLISPFGIEYGFHSCDISKAIQSTKFDSNVKFQLKNQFPVMLNRYRRKYFESFDKKFRITLDDQQYFYKVHRFGNSFNDYAKNFESVILEIKYNKMYDDVASEISNHFPFRLTKSSKYSKGIEMLYFQ